MWPKTTIVYDLEPVWQIVLIFMKQEIKDWIWSDICYQNHIVGYNCTPPPRLSKMSFLKGF